MHACFYKISLFSTRYEIDELKKGFLAVEKFSVSIGDTLSLTMGEQKRLENVITDKL